MDFPVLIIGAGPSGATTALHLARMGVKSLVISRHHGSANTPRAHIFNQRAMEVLRDADIEGSLNSVASPACDMQHTSWLHSLASEEYGRLWAWGNKPSQKGDYESSSPCVMSDLPQSILEPILVEEVRRLGSEVRFSTEFVEFEEAEEGLRTTLRDHGARSAVLDALKIPIIGKQLNTAFNVHIKADLTKYIAHRPGSLNWILNPDAPDWSAVGNFRMVRPWNEFVVSLHPATKDGKAFAPTEDQILERLYQMIGDKSIKIEILSSFQWTINDQVAERWQQGRVLCIGDATHRHPPINGLGSNTCLSDAFNLAWKLAYVIRGYAAPSLLETLTSERKPVGDAIVKRANAGMEAHRRLWDLMGLTPQARQDVVQKLQEATSEGAEMREKLRLALEATEDEVQALGIQMNQTYLNSSAVVVEDGDFPRDFSALNFLKDVMVSTFPGYHLPHVWLAANGQSERISSLDLAGHGRFTLFTGIGGGAWLKAAEMISSRSGVQVKGCSIGFRCEYMDCYREWVHVRGVGETGVVLVRPDHFVAWRCKELPGNCLEKLSSVLSKVLGKNV
ncbi:putative FAD dependent oxidoreductase [Zopfia rhizophila CBS 207.26]|uniref:Putative FAD dependent oxidoreductase n=1 Tax=Zopfia rhizophila CBS 207.26 TaxID=1314779 RepID=A0A6A6EE69_9PEZI|nr:putative FAD dependent oxidoreductase [Zopfia rhizophila CBS 207.26]